MPQFIDPGAQTTVRVIQRNAHGDVTRVYELRGISGLRMEVETAFIDTTTFGGPTAQYQSGQYRTRLEVVAHEVFNMHPEQARYMGVLEDNEARSTAAKVVTETRKFSLGEK